MSLSNNNQAQRIKALMHGESSIISEKFIAEKEKELVDKVCMWTMRLLIYPSALAVLVGYLSEEGIEQLINPACVVLSCLLVRVFVTEASTQGATILVVLALMAFRHAILYQGCSACVVPSVYCFIPCASGLLFRTTRSVFISSAFVLTLIAIIYTIDLTGNCPSEPIATTDKAAIVADRLIPLLNSIVGNTLIFFVIFRQSRESLLMHTEAATSARNLANLRRDVLHRVTHELRTPLNGLVGSVELLTVSDTLSAHDMENVETIKRCLNSILGICDDVLIAAKESDKGDPFTNEEHPFVLSSVVDDVVEVFAAAVQAKGIQLKVQFEGNTRAVVHGLEVRLRQVLLNLVGNAIKFTDTGSVTIAVETEEVASGDEGKNGSNMLRCKFRVSDTGIGIDKENAEILFQPFHQGEQGRAVSRRHQGTGLGLTICRDLVHQLGGSITADGVRGKGASFYFTLIMKKEEKEATGEASSSIAEQIIAEKITNPEKQSLLSSIQNDTTGEITTSNRDILAPFCIVLADAEKESLLSCQSVIKSVIPSRSGQTIIFDSQDELVDHITMEAEEKKRDKGTKIAFVEYNSSDPQFSSMLLKAKKLGWILLLYCNREEFADVIERTTHIAYAVFRRPLPLIRLGDTLHNALQGVHVDEICDSKHKDDDTRQSIASPVSASRVAQEMSTGVGVIHPKAKLVVVDDIEVNVKLLVKMLSRCTSTDIVPILDGESAIKFAQMAKSDEILLYVLDWHMPRICGLTAWQSIRKITEKRGGPRIFVCMVTADIEGFCEEIQRCEITYGATISRSGVIAKRVNTKEVVDAKSEGGAVIDIITGKPVTFLSVQAILKCFKDTLIEDSVKEESAN